MTVPGSENPTGGTTSDPDPAPQAVPSSMNPVFETVTAAHEALSNPLTVNVKV
jgi:hypothetical protein